MQDEQKDNTRVLHLQIPVAPAYQSEFFQLMDTSVEITIPLTDGVHTLTTHSVVIGHWKGFADLEIYAKLTIWYEYFKEDNMVSFCGSDYISENSAHLTTWLEDTDQRCVQYSYEDARNVCGVNAQWNYCTPSAPGLKELFRQVIARANALIIDKAKRSQLNVLEYSPFPEMSKEDFDKFHLVYHKGEFLELYDPEKSYSNEHEVVNILSVYKGPFEFAEGQHFANVLKSTGDPLPSGAGSWIKLWEVKVNDGKIPEACTSYKLDGFECDKRLSGGHVILGDVAKKVKKGDNNSVFITPICEPHNHDDSVYMEPITTRKAVALKKYFRKGK